MPDDVRSLDVREISREKPMRLTRDATFIRGEANEDDRTVPLSFSSEKPVERWWGIEILGHEKDECDLSWMASGSAPFLMDHNTRDQIGVVKTAEIGTDRKGRAIVRFGRSARAEEMYRDALDGVRVNVSVGYEITRAQLIEEKEGVGTYRCDWRPLEISLVSIPADMAVGVGRAQPIGESIMTGETLAAVQASAADEAVRKERQRRDDIMELSTRHQRRDLGEKAIRDGLSIEQFRGIMLEVIGADRPLYKPLGEIGLSSRDAQSYSFMRAIFGAAARQRGEKPMQDDSFEQECHRATEKSVGKAAAGFYVPTDVQLVGSDMRPEQLRRAIALYQRMMQRDLLVGTPTAGGNLVATDLLAGNFIDLLRNRMMVRQMGATVLNGLVGNVAIPRQTGSATAAWVGENAAPAESQQTVGQVTMSPKTIAAYTDFSRLLKLQSTPAIEQLVRNDLVTLEALAIDLAALHGTGSANQPAGIAATAGIGSVVGGTNGAAPTWDNIVILEEVVAVANGDAGPVGYLTNAKVRSKLKRSQRFPSTNGEPIWGVDTVPTSGFGTLNGSRAGVSNQVSSTLTKGTSSGICSAIFYGNWQDLLIGEWGVLDILVDPYTGSNAGTVRVNVFQTVDIAVRNAASFAAMLDALTT